MINPNSDSKGIVKTSDWRASIDIEVPFYDVDMMNIVWHGNYIKYFEQARCKLLDLIGYNYQSMGKSGYAWPIIDVHIRYARPVAFRQIITVTASLVEYEHRLKIKYLVTDTATGRRLTKGYTTQVAVDIKTNEMCYQSPAVLLEKLQNRQTGSDDS